MTARDMDLVEREWALICPMEPLYAEQSYLEPLHEQAVQVLELEFGNDEPNVQEWIAAEAARRTAGALALLCHGGNWDVSPSNAPIDQGTMPRRS